MNQASEQIILDLLPLYQAGKCSPETKKLIDTYFRDNPAFADEHQKIAPFPTPQLETPDELKLLKRTRFYLKMKSLLLFCGIFALLMPFAYGDILSKNDEGWRWLWTDQPIFAFLFILAGIVCWILYLLLRKALKVTNL